MLFCQVVTEMDVGLDAFQRCLYVPEAPCQIIANKLLFCGAHSLVRVKAARRIKSTNRVNYIRGGLERSLGRFSSYEPPVGASRRGRPTKVFTGGCFRVILCFMSSPEQSNHKPVWATEFDIFIRDALAGRVAKESELIIAATGSLCMLLLQEKTLSNLGELQTYLRQEQALIQLVAHPFDPTVIATPNGTLVNLRCLDAVSDEPRGHWLMVCLVEPDGAEIRSQLANLSMSDEINETTLARDTGFLAPEF